MARMRNVLTSLIVMFVAMMALPAAYADLLVSSFDNDSVLRYDQSTGTFISAFVPSGSGGLDTPRGLAFGPDGNLYVSSSFTNSVLRYNGTTGAFINAFVPSGSGGLITAFGLSFGPDANLYVASLGANSVLRYNGTTAWKSLCQPSGPGRSHRAPQWRHRRVPE